MPKPITDQNGRIKLPNSNTFISPEMIEDIIEMSESAITGYKLKQSEISEPMLKAEEDMNEAYDYYIAAKNVYDNLKKNYDDFEDKVKRKKNIIALHNHIKTGKKIEDVPVFEKISNNTVKISKRADRIPWNNLAVKYLKDTNRFTRPLDLMKGILETNPEVKKEFMAQKKHDYSRMWNIGNNILQSALRKPNPKASYKIVVKAYDGKIGLPEWFDQNGSLLPQYVNQFMG